MDNSTAPDLIGDVLAVVGERVRAVVDPALGEWWGRLIPGDAAAEPDPSGARLPLLALTTELEGRGRPFAATLGRAGARAAETLLAASSAWAAGEPVDAESSIRVVDSAARLLRVLGDEDAAERVSAAGSAVSVVAEEPVAAAEPVADVEPDAEPVGVVEPVVAAEPIVAAEPVDAPALDEDAIELPPATSVNLGDFAIPQDSNPFYSQSTFAERMQRGTADLFGIREPEPEPAPVAQDPIVEPEPEPEPELETEPEPEPAVEEVDEEPGAIAAFFAAAGVVPTTPASAARAATERHGLPDDAESDDPEHNSTPRTS
ncbi:hypothetical protein HQQ81_13015 [Microbacteriaceae bacterium VKM Ac-2854]|nr:hypothetical protein [Microbacteriaceae bacterium VKM Ac-2854]